ncbi:MAG: hypothetical protein WC437_04770 [Patescibacteria group bacterium]
MNNKISQCLTDSESFDEFLSGCYIELKEQLVGNPDYEEVKRFAQDIWDEHQSNVGN